MTLPHANISIKVLLKSQIGRSGNRLFSWIIKAAMPFGRTALRNFLRKLAFIKRLPEDKLLYFRLLIFSKDKLRLFSPSDNFPNSFGPKITRIQSFLLWHCDSLLMYFRHLFPPTDYKCRKNRPEFSILVNFVPDCDIIMSGAPDLLLVLNESFIKE